MRRENFDMKRYNVKKLNYVEVIGKYVAKIPNRFAGLETMGRDDDVEKRKVWESTGGDISASCTENLGFINFKEHKQ
jgi:hypothetical protein